MPSVDLIRETLHVIMANPECCHDLVLALIYFMAIPTVIFWHQRIWLIYGLAFLAYFVSALEAAGLF